MLILLSLSSMGQSFLSYEQAKKAIGEHLAVQGTLQRAASIKEMAQAEGSWGDPVFKIGVKNLPKDSLKNDETPMSGIDFGITQKIALTNKYGNLKKSLQMESQGVVLDAQELRELFMRDFWNLLLEKKKVQSDLSVMKENKNWILKMLSISKRLYVNGKIGQAALFDIEIRKSDIETNIEKLQLKNKEIDSSIGYYTSSDLPINLNTVPWKNVEIKKNEIKDFRLEKLESKLQGREYDLKAKRLNYIPDISVSLTYTKREDLDKKGDFVGAAISFPLPFSDKSSSAHEQSAFLLNEAKANLNNYKNQKDYAIKKLNFEIEQIESEIRILGTKTFDHAKASRDVTAKSYGLGSATYFELLKSELQWQDVQLKMNDLVTKKLSKKIQMKYLRGETLYAN